MVVDKHLVMLKGSNYLPILSIYCISCFNTGLFAPDVIDTALRGANSCNAVVRAVSESVLDLAEFN